ncbi:MAG: twin-arginine translocation signal domain-containing protein, partial [Bacteroidota bacterium]
MQTSRRNFIKQGAVALAGSAILSTRLLAFDKEEQLLGIQLYSIRDDMKKDPLGTLKQLSQ